MFPTPASQIPLPYRELTHTEIAQQLRLPEGTVKGRVRLGLERLRRHVEDAG